MKPEISKAAVERLPRYLRCLEQLPSSQTTISSTELARLSNLNSAKVRKDLSYLGSYGVRGVGYNVSELTHQFRRELGLTRDRAVAVIGVGNLGSALARYGGFMDRGFTIVGLYDSDPDKIGTTVDEFVVRSISQLPQDAKEYEIAVGIITTPASAAQDVATLLIESGVPAILNFAPAVLSVGPETQLRQVDLATELQILGFYTADGHHAIG